MNRIPEGLQRAFSFLTSPSNSGLRVVVLCVFGATVFWFLNAMNETYNTTIDYPLRYKFSRENYVAIQTPPRSVKVNVTGNGWNLLRYSFGFQLNPLTVKLQNLPQNNALATNNILPGITEQLKELDVKYVVKDTLQFRFDSLGKRTLHLSIDSAAVNLAPGCRIVSPVKVSPSRLRVQGPSSGLDTLPETITLSVPDNGIDKSYDKKLPLTLLPDSLFDLSRESVKVQFEVQSFKSHKQRVPVNIVSADTTDSLRAVPRLVRVRYLWPENKSSLPSAGAFNVTADFDERNPEDSTVVLHLAEKPSSARELMLSPKTVKVFHESP